MRDRVIVRLDFTTPAQGAYPAFTDALTFASDDGMIDVAALVSGALNATDQAVIDQQKADRYAAFRADCDARRAAPSRQAQVATMYDTLMLLHDEYTQLLAARDVVLAQLTTRGQPMTAADIAAQITSAGHSITEADVQTLLSALGEETA